jgi:hypothetical protein
MTRSMHFHDYAAMPPSERAALDAAVRPLRTLEAVLRWARTSEPSWSLAEIVTQDEYTHDVVLASPGQPYLVFDTT